MYVMFYCELSKIANDNNHPSRWVSNHVSHDILHCQLLQSMNPGQNLELNVNFQVIQYQTKPYRVPSLKIA